MAALKCPIFTKFAACLCRVSSSSRSYSTIHEKNLKSSDPLVQSQISQLNDCCGLVDVNDRFLGCASKREAHLVQPNGKALLHRAFSVFLFDTSDRLLIQQRSKYKLIFPRFISNSCCSHPVGDSNEMTELDNIGIKRAAMRRLNHELGIPIKSMQFDDFSIVNRVRYYSSFDGVWGENEIDYCIVLRNNLEINPNPSEILAYSYITKDQLLRLLKEDDSTDSIFPVSCDPDIWNEIKMEKAPLSPWFRAISKKFLLAWFDNVPHFADTFRFDENGPIINLGCLDTLK